MSWRSCAGWLALGVLAGCGPSEAVRDARVASLLGSYEVMISSLGKSDPDVMTVRKGRGGQLLFSFAVGVTTEPRDGQDGLRGVLHGSSMLSFDRQLARIEHSTGRADGSLTGMGTLRGDGRCDLTLSFIADDGAGQSYEVMGAKE